MPCAVRLVLNLVELASLMRVFTDFWRHSCRWPTTYRDLPGPPLVRVAGIRDRWRLASGTGVRRTWLRLCSRRPR